MKNYLLTLQQNCSDELFGQEAVEHAIITGELKLTYNLVTDLHQVFDELSNCCDAPADGETCEALTHVTGRCRHCKENAIFIRRYDEFCAAYRQHSRQNEAVLVESYSGLLEEILRPQPLLPALPSKDLVRV